MIIIPISHESQAVRRIPLVTIIIMGLCLVVHLIIYATMRQLEKDLEVAMRDMFQYYFQRTYLELDPKVKKLFGITEEFLAEVEKAREAEGEDDDTPIGVIVEDEQGELNRLCQRFLDTYEQVPFKKWGYVPANRSFLKLFTYMFIHGGWLHLLGNLYLLYLTGPFIEDLWGKPVFIALYLVTGMLAAQMFALHYPNFGGPLIGASGAIAGVMGAFLVKFWKTKIRFFYWIIILAGTFRAPAWLMLPIWVFLEYQSAKFMDAVRLPGGGGVAHWAHVWGFFFGFATAMVLKFSGVEDKYIKPKVDAGLSYQADGLNYYEEAMALAQDGKRKQAFDKLLEGAREFPTNKEIVEALWNLGVEIDKKKSAAFYFLKLIEHELREKEFDLAVRHYGSLREHVPDASLSNQGKLLLIDYLLKQNEPKVALKLTNELVDGLRADSPVGYLLQLHEVAVRLEFLFIDKKIASPDEKIVAIMLQHPDIPESKKAELRAKSEKLPRVEEKAPTGADFFSAETPLSMEDNFITEPSAVSHGKGGEEINVEIDSNADYGIMPPVRLDDQASAGAVPAAVGQPGQPDAVHQPPAAPGTPAGVTAPSPPVPPIPPPAGVTAPQQGDDPYKTVQAADPPGVDTVKIGMIPGDKPAASGQLGQQPPAAPPAQAGPVQEIPASPQGDRFRSDAAISPDHIGAPPQRDRFKTDTAIPPDHIGTPPLEDRYKTEIAAPGDIIAVPQPLGEAETVISPPAQPQAPVSPPPVPAGPQAAFPAPLSPPPPQVQSQAPAPLPTPPAPAPQVVPPQPPRMQPQAPAGPTTTSPHMQQAPVRPPTAPPPPSTVQPTSQPPSQRIVHVTKAAALGFKESKIVLNIENVGQRTFSLDKIQAVSTARITPHGAQPFFLIDLLIDDPRGGAACVRTVRLSSPQINFRQLFPSAQSWLQAFVMFTTTLLKLSGGSPFPDLPSVQLQSAKTFLSIKDYDNFLLS